MSVNILTRGVARLGILALALPLTASGWGGREANSGSMAPDALPCVVQCGSGSGVGCSQGWHTVWSSEVDQNASGEPHSECKCCSCSTAHDCSSIEGLNEIQTAAGLVRAVSMAVEVGDSSGLVASLARTTRNVTINRDRSAVQVLDCSGAVLAHLPVSDAWIATAASSASPNQ